MTRLDALRVGAAALNQGTLDWDGNLARIEAAVGEARAAGVGLLCLPELAIPGHGAEDLFRAPFVAATSLEVLEAIAASTKELLVTVGLPIEHEGARYDAHAVLFDGALVALVPKQALSEGPLFDERRWFDPWPPTRRVTTRVLGREVPLGPLELELGREGLRVGLDLEETLPSPALARARGLDVVLHPIPSHFALGRSALRRAHAAAGARRYDATYVMANLLGNEAGTTIHDGLVLIASPSRSSASDAAGDDVALTEGPRFSFRDHTLVHAPLADRAARRPGERDRLVLEGTLVRGPSRASLGAAARAGGLEASRFEDLVRALGLALFDYLRRSRTRGFVVSLSGGTDSALVATAVALMVRLARAELSQAELAARLADVPGLEGLADERALVGALLTTLYQATPQSGEATRSAARRVAEALGARHHECDVGPLVAGYVERAEAALGRPLDWARDDVALQNVQARTRSPMAWMLANVEGKLLLATGNRSEAAVGYATMDGDTAGSLAPIGSVDKHSLRALLRWLASEASGELRVAALGAVDAIAPTAELRPADRHQTDEDDLMPYELLDRIERLVVDERRAPEEAFALLREADPGLDVEALGVFLARFIRLFFQSQWKRERFAPALHLDDRSLDAKSAVRLPILSSGLARELERLARVVRAARAARG